MKTVHELAVAAGRAKYQIAGADGNLKDAVLFGIAEKLRSREAQILQANTEDIKNAEKNGLAASFIERLTVNHNRIESMAQGAEEVARLKDPVGEVVWGATRPNGLQIVQKRVPLGVIAIIFESRPNVTVDAAALCIKSGNAVILRGGKEAISTNIVLAQIIRDALKEQGLPEDCVCLVEDTSRNSAAELMNQTGLVDLLIPRGGKGLIQAVVEGAKVPVIETGAGNCHVYIDETADLDTGYRIIENAKMSRPSVCNAAETLLVHSSVAAEFLPMVRNGFGQDCELRGCDRTTKIIDVKPADENDWYTEYNDYVLAIRIVDSVGEAIEHINKYNTKHSECIVTENIDAASRFTEEIDAAVVYVNASTRFTDGGEFGMGAEIGISTSKLHARGPMGLQALTTTKYTVQGNGQTR